MSVFATGSTISKEFTRLGGLLSAVIVLGVSACTYVALNTAFGHSGTADPAKVRVQPIAKPKLARLQPQDLARQAARHKSQADPFVQRARAVRRHAERELARLRAHSVPLLQKVHSRPHPLTPVPATAAPPAQHTPTLTVKKQPPAPPQNSGGTAAPTATTAPPSTAPANDGP